MPPSHKIAIVVDAGFGEKLFDIAKRMPVWIADSAINREAVNRWRTFASKNINNYEVTIYCGVKGDPPERWLENVIEDVDLCHNQFSKDPPYWAVEVYGMLLTEQIKEFFVGYGFYIYRNRHNGFYSSKYHAKA